MPLQTNFTSDARATATYVGAQAARESPRARQSSSSRQQTMLLPLEEELLVDDDSTNAADRTKLEYAFCNYSA